MTDPLACGHERPTADPGSDCLICASVWASAGAPTVPGQIQGAYCAHGDDMGCLNIPYVAPEPGVCVYCSEPTEPGSLTHPECEEREAEAFRDQQEEHRAEFASRCRDPRTEAKSVKPQPQLVPFGFVMAMGDVFAEGLTDGRSPGGWQGLDSAQVAHDYRGALLRHYHAGEWAAVAVNAAILWWHERKAKR